MVNFQAGDWTQLPWAFLQPTAAPLQRLTTALTPLILGLHILEAAGEMILMTSQVWEGICAFLSGSRTFFSFGIHDPSLWQNPGIVIVAFYVRERIRPGGAR